VMERMGCEGRIMTFVESDSPPAWGVLGVMNFSPRELDCVRWMTWLEADEEYERRELLLFCLTDEIQLLRQMRVTCQ
jgi:hypothetical protein